MRAAVIVSVMCLLLFSSSQASQTAIEAIRIWGLDIIPSLFPYMVLCQALMAQFYSRQSSQQSSKKMTVIVSLLGLVGGSPSGSAALSAGMPQANSSFRLILSLAALNGTLSPMFFLEPVTAWTKSSADGRMLLFVHLTAAAASALLVFFFARGSSCHRIQPDLRSETPVNPIERSVNCVLTVGGCIVFFSVMASLIRSLFPHADHRLLAYIHALMEISGGIKTLLHAEIPYFQRMVLSASALGFSGFSVLAQNLAFLKPLGITMTHLLLIALLRSFLSAVLMSLVLLCQ